MENGDDLKANLTNYQIQLEQAEAALKHEQDADRILELEKLRDDLKEVIALTKQLMSGNNTNEEPRKRQFKSGDVVLAPYSEDGLHYQAVIEDITADGQVNLFFPPDTAGSRTGFYEVCLVSLLKPLEGGSNSGGGSNASSSSGGNKGKRRGEKRSRQTKRTERLKEVEEEREREKNKWQSFHAKCSKRSGSSIFASPSTVEGKVGVGTCGIGGKPMTEYVKGEKVKRGKMMKD